MSGGAPTKYKTAYNGQAEKLCKLGATDAELAEFFEVVESTINLWKIEHPKFSESIKKGKTAADVVIANKLHSRAAGAVVKIQQAHKVKTVKYVKGKRVETESIEVVTLKQEYPPDTTAAIFWLKNRQPKKWRDKQEIDVRTPEGISVTYKQQEGNAPLDDTD